MVAFIGRDQLVNVLFEFKAKSPTHQTEKSQIPSQQHCGSNNSALAAKSETPNVNQSIAKYDDKHEQASSESGINPSSSECDSNDDNPVKGNEFEELT